MDDSTQIDAERARAEIASGALRGSALLDRLLAVPPLSRDAWVDALLAIEPLPPDDPALPRGAVPYLPCGVDEIVLMSREAPVSASDTLVDLGSGLGRVAILAHLATGARARGIEIQAHLVQSAITRAAELGLAEVSFVHGDASETELEGTIFFLYAPCTGAMLARLIARLEAVARRHPIVVCAVGVELRAASWLVERRTSSPSLVIYDSRTR